MIILNARFPEQDVRLTKRICKARGEDVADFLRRAVRKELASLNVIELNDLERRALGLDVGGGSD